jgi:nicotinamidase-related amidase
VTVTTLDPATALIIVDLQNAIMTIPTAHPNTEVVANAAKLADAFRANGLPVVLVNAAGGAPGRNELPPRGAFGVGIDDPLGIVPELHQATTDHLVTKRTWGAFTGTDLNDYLNAQGVTQVVICGIATSAGVESTARHAHENGYNVTLATDAMTDRSVEVHDHVITNVFPRIGETGTTGEILALLPRPSTSSGTGVA